MSNLHVMVGLALPALAATVTVPARAADLARRGFAQADGFTLVEHRQASAFSAARTAAPQARASILKVRPALPTSRSRARMLGFVRAAEMRHSLPQGLLDALIAIESGYSRWAVSRAGAAGLAQLMPGTAVELGIADRFDPVQSIEGGARYLRRMLDRFGSVSLALAAYNAGPGSVQKSGGIPDNGETPLYVARVLQRWASLPVG